jgi:hypothetical protein
VLGLQACTTKCGLKDTVQPKYTSAVVEKPSTTFFFWALLNTEFTFQHCQGERRKKER